MQMTDEDEDEIPHLEETNGIPHDHGEGTDAHHPHGCCQPGEGTNDILAPGGPPLSEEAKAKQSRGEKKARKIMSKLGLKPVWISILNFDFF